MDWVIHQQGLLYHQEYGWDETFEALVAQICADFINKYDPQKERCWIAEMQGERVGSIFEEHHHSFGHDLVGQNWDLTFDH